MKADPSVVANLQTTAALLAHLAEQFRVDKYQLKAMDVDFLARRVCKFYHSAEQHLGIVIKALIYFEADPAYNAGDVTSADSITALLQRDRDLAYAAFDQACAFRKAAWDVRGDYVPDIYEHIVEALTKIVIKCERELALIAALTEAGYVGARLDDAS